jgi:hypothetical protein
MDMVISRFFFTNTDVVLKFLRKYRYENGDISTKTMLENINNSIPYAIYLTKIIIIWSKIFFYD